MRIAIGSDHAGFELKEEVKKFLSINRMDFKDFGTYNGESCDYPDYTEKVCRAVLDEGFDRGVLVCGSGIGMSIAANKFKGIYAALCMDTYTAEMSRKHNDSNVLILAGRITAKELGKEILRIWLNSDFEKGRHEKRTDKIKEIESRLF